MDLRGHGGSRAPGATLTIQRLSEDVAELLHALDLEDAIGIGWSLGASVLWKTLGGPERHRFAGAVVIDMTPRVLNDQEWRLGLAPELCEARKVAMREDFPSFAATAGQAIFAQPLADGKQELADRASIEFARNDATAIAHIWGSLVEEDLRGLLGAIHQPTLIVHGAHSQLYGPGTAEFLAGALRDASTVRFDKSGHAPHLEEPDLFNQLIRDFSARLLRDRKAQATAR
jgi:pimeloyl-[acyl-carrier protein] methyl ester esterase